MEHKFLLFVSFLGKLLAGAPTLFCDVLLRGDLLFSGTFSEPPSDGRVRRHRFQGLFSRDLPSQFPIFFWPFCGRDFCVLNKEIYVVLISSGFVLDQIFLPE